MKLAELAFACYIYSSMTGYDSSYNHFRQETAPRLDLSDDEHRIALIAWLNKWGCRHFSLAYHDLASEEIGRWYQQYGRCFFSAEKPFLDLTASDLALVEKAFANLSARTASMKRRTGGKRFEVSIGPTATAKILFALRPKALVAWDASMRVHFRLDGTAACYMEYLRVIRERLEELDQACKAHGLRLSDLPELLNRPASSPPTMIDEFFWVTVTRGCAPPSEKTLERWVKWS